MTSNQPTDLYQPLLDPSPTRLLVQASSRRSSKFCPMPPLFFSRRSAAVYRTGPTRITRVCVGGGAQIALTTDGQSAGHSGIGKVYTGTMVEFILNFASTFVLAFGLTWQK